MSNEKVSKVSSIVSAIESLSVLELSELVEQLKKRFNISEALYAPSEAVRTVASQVEAKKEEKTEFTVILEGVGENKLQVLKEIRAATGLGLRESKELIDNVPSKIKENISKNEAEELKKKLEGVGAKVKIE